MQLSFFITISIYFKVNILEFRFCYRSPRILITRAFSEESEKNSQTSSPNRDINKKHSTSASNLIEKRWRHTKFQVINTMAVTFSISIRSIFNLILVHQKHRLQFWDSWYFWVVEFAITPLSLSLSLIRQF